MAHILDVDLLRTFHAVARLGRFKDAATHLGKSTSAISVHIQRLEEIIGARLLERDNQRSVLSARGRQLLDETGGFLAEHDRIVAALSAAPVKGKIRLGIPEEYAGTVLKQFLPLFTMENPGVELAIEAGASEALTSLFDRDRLDMAITVRRDAAVGRHKTLSTVQPVWVVSNDMRALSQDVVPIALHAEGCPYRKAAITSLRQSGAAWRIILTSGNSGAIFAAVEAGVALAVMSRGQLSRSMVTAPKTVKLHALKPHKIVLQARSATAAEKRLEASIARYFESSTL
jgi:DNA-binding transcriptional LysR family regulator